MHESMESLLICVCLSVCTSEVINSETRKYLSNNHKTSHIGTYQARGNLIKFRVQLVRPSGLKLLWKSCFVHISGINRARDLKYGTKMPPSGLLKK